MSKPIKAQAVVAKAQATHFTGVARTLVCENNNGFRNFRILTFHILDGVVINEEKTDCFAGFEAITKMEKSNLDSYFKLNNRWAQGLGMRDFDEPGLPPDPKLVAK